MKKFAIKEALKGKILKASLGLMLINLFGKVLGYGEKLLLAKYFGTNYEVDVYTVVLAIIFSFFYFFREIIEPGFLRVFIEKSEENNNGKEWHIFNYGFRIIFGVTILITAIIYVFPGNTIKLFAPGFNEVKFDLASDLLRASIIACVFLSLSTLTGIILNAQKKFLLPASGDLIFKLVIIISFFIIDFEKGILGISVVIVIAALLKLVTHLFGLLGRLSFSKLSIDNKDRAKILKLSLPLLVGVIFSQLSGIVDNNFASRLQEGAISSISYAKKIIELPIVVLPYVLSVVIFPFFSELSIQSETRKLNTLFLECLKWIVIVFIPVSLFFIFYSLEIIELIFERGAFNKDSTALTATPFFIYSFGLIFFALETIIVIFYFAKADTKTPVVIGIFGVVLNIFLTWFLIDSMGYLSIPVAYVIQKIVKNCILLFNLRNDLFSIKKLVSKRFLLFILFSSLFLGISFFLNIIFPAEIDGKIVKASILCLFFIIPSAVYFFLLWKFNFLKLNKVFFK